MRERFELDPAHTVIGFSTKHLGVSTVRGHFARFSGAFEADPDSLSGVSGEVTVEVQSITTNVDQRDGHLRSGDFFEAEKHPTVTFRLTGIEKVGDDTYRVRGDLTIKETTRSITLDGTLEGDAPNPFGPGRRLGVTVTGQLNRMDYGLNWDGVAGLLPVAGHNIKLQIDAELVATPVEAEATTA